MSNYVRKRYIDAELLKSYLNPIAQKTRCNFIPIIDNIPTADVEEVRHGCWVHTDNYDMYHTPIYSCSACYHEIPTRYITVHSRCPHCGAKMDTEVK